MRFLCPFVFLLPLAAAVGCDSSGLVPAAGSLAYDGQPLAKGTVTLVPVDVEAKLRPAQALSKDDGTFELSTGNLRGAMPGKYHVLVAKDVPADAPAEATPAGPWPGGGTLSDADREAAGRAMQRLSRMPVRSVIPKRYESPLTSPLECTIPPAGTRDLRFELKSEE